LLYLLSAGCGNPEVPVELHPEVPVELPVDTSMPAIEASFRIRAGHLEFRKLEFSDGDSAKSKAFFDAHWRAMDQCYVDALAFGEFCGREEVKLALDRHTPSVSVSVLVDTVDAPAGSTFNECLSAVWGGFSPSDPEVLAEIAVVFAPTEDDIERCSRK